MNYLYNDLQVFLLNLCFVFILFYIYYKFIENKINQLAQKILISIISGISIILCMTFPVSPNHDFMFDMRQVPFIIGALYGGRRVAFFLLIVLLSYRFYIHADSGFYATLIIYPVLFLVLFYVTPLFHKVNKIKQKVGISVLVSILGFLYMVVVVDSFDPYFNDADMIILLLLYSTQFCVQALFINFIEKTRRDIMILEELRTLEKLKIVSDIAASISHEVRNPLTVTRGFIQLLRDPILSEEKKNLYITLSLNELDRAESIITDYLTFAKPSLNNVELLELNKELDYIIKVVTPYATMRNVHIEVNKDYLITIYGDAQKLHQCLINIIKNGIEAMEQGGLLQINLKEVKDHALIKIKDSGKGMDAEQVNRLGTPFYSTKEKGTGLGTMVVCSTSACRRSSACLRFIRCCSSCCSSAGTANRSDRRAASSTSPPAGWSAVRSRRYPRSTTMAGACGSATANGARAADPLRPETRSGSRPSRAIA